MSVQSAPVRNRAVVYSSASPSASPAPSPGFSDASRPGYERHNSSSRSGRSLLPSHKLEGGADSSRSPPFISTYNWWRIRRVLARPLPWVIITLFALVIWWSNGAREELQSPEVQTKLRELFPPEITRDLQFFPASNHKIHYVGRWTAAPNRLRIDGAFPGVYLDLNITNTTSLVLSLQNARNEATPPTPLPTLLTADEHINEPRQESELHSQYSFTSKARVASPPVSLLALVDDDEYVILPNATSLVTVRMKDMNRALHHTVRIIAPMNDNGGVGIVQFDGLWLDKGGQLLPVEGSTAASHGEDEDDLSPESDEIGKKHRLGLSNMLHRFDRDQIQKDNNHEDEEASGPHKRRKLLEIITDTPAHLSGRRGSARSGGSDGLLSGVMGWEYLLGEMFSVDHVCVGVEGMCLVHDCVGGTGSPSGMGDVFFRSGPVNSPHYGHPWPFQSYVPDVLIMNLGASDFYSFENHLDEYNKTGGELFRSFEDTYVSLVKAVRNLAYPQHPSVIEMERLGLEAYANNDAPANIPIFIMRPFNGELEHATQGAVKRLRDEGDKGVFWLDTTGWLDTVDTERSASDFFTDQNDPEMHPHLTERGNQKVAIYLHMHVCRFLAAEEGECAFLPPEVYQGNVYDPSVATFDRYVETEKQRQIKETFFEDERGL